VTRGALVEVLSHRFDDEKGGHAGEETAKHSQGEKEDNGVAVSRLAVYAVYDEGFEKDGAVL
jgi:hypothetical protein